MQLFKKLTAKIPYSLVPDSLMEHYTDELIKQAQHSIEIEDKLQTVENENKAIRKDAGELLREHQLLKSSIVGEARITMRSIRRANAMKWLFILAIITLAAIAFYKRK